MRALLVEDNEPLATTVAQGLREAGYAVDVSNDGKNGLARALAVAYDVIVLDLMLPGIDGLSLLSELRRHRSNVHVLILTARDATRDRIEGLDAGADDYLVKPFAFEELLARVNALVRRKYDIHSRMITVGDLQVDTAAKEVRWRGESIQLTAREFGLIEVLALCKGRVVTRTEISEHLYGFDSEPNSNANDTRSVICTTGSWAIAASIVLRAPRCQPRLCRPLRGRADDPRWQRRRPPRRRSHGCGRRAAAHRPA